MHAWDVGVNLGITPMGAKLDRVVSGLLSETVRRSAMQSVRTLGATPERATIPCGNSDTLLDAAHVDMLHYTRKSGLG
jgi:hypothetical protein